MRFYVFLVFFLLPACLSLPPAPALRGTSADISTHSHSRPSPSFQIYLPFVGQGDATLVRTSSGKTLLIDAGPPSAATTYLLPLLSTLGVSHVDALVVTHYDLDHLGGVPGLLAGADGQMGSEDDITVGTAYDRGGTPWDSSPGYPDYLQALGAAGVLRQTLHPGDEIGLDEGLTIRCLAANGEVFDGGEIRLVDLTPATYSGQENAASVALLVETEGFRYLTAGDLTGGGSTDGFLTPDVETLLAEAAGAVDVVHANHHGSLSSSNANFVAATSPEAVFIQAGVDNPYGHPKVEVVKAWEEAGARVYSTATGKGYRLDFENGDFSIGEIDL